MCHQGRAGYLVAKEQQVPKLARNRIMIKINSYEFDRIQTFHFDQKTTIKKEGDTQIAPSKEIVP